VGSVVVALCLPFVAALGWDDYSHLSQYISELGAQGAPNGALVSLGFVAVGLLILVSTAVMVVGVERPRLALVGIVLIGGGLGGSYAITGLARCDAGCPESGPVSTAQEIHNAVGVPGYVVAIAGVLVFAIGVRRMRRWRGESNLWFLAAAVLVVLATLTPAMDSWRGALQRLIELVLLTCLVAAGRIAPAPTRGAPDN